jgi:hypothetical protein
MNSDNLHRTLLKLAIASMCLVAVFAVLFVCGSLFEIRFGTDCGKLALTFAIVAVACVCAVSCLKFRQGGSKNEFAATVGLFLTVLAAFLVAAGLWTETRSPDFWKVTVSLAALSLAFAYGFRLVRFPLPRNREWVHSAGIACLVVLVTMFVAAVLSEQEGGLFAVLFMVDLIFVLLLAGVIPKLSTLHAGETVSTPPPPLREQHPRQLVLEFVSDGIYRDESGTLFGVQRLSGRGGSERRGEFPI